MTPMTPRQAIDHYIPKLPGGEWPKCLPTCHTLYGLIMETQARISVEIGVFGGCGLLAMGFAHRELQNQGMSGTYCIGIDPWAIGPAIEGKHASENDAWNQSLDWEGIFRGVQDSIGAHHIAPWCRLRREKSLEVVKDFANGVIKVLHQDGNHAEEIVCAEVEAFAPKMAEESWWVADDVDWAENGVPTWPKAEALLIKHGFVLEIDHGGWRIFKRSKLPIGEYVDRALASMKPTVEVPVNVVEPAIPEPTVASQEVIP